MPKKKNLLKYNVCMHEFIKNDVKCGIVVLLMRKTRVYRQLLSLFQMCSIVLQAIIMSTESLRASLIRTTMIFSPVWILLCLAKWPDVVNPLAQILQMYLRLCSRSSSSDNVFLGSVLCFRVFREYLLFAILLYASLETIPFSGCCIIDELQVSCDSELFRMNLNYIVPMNCQKRRFLFVN